MSETTAINDKMISGFKGMIIEKEPLCKHTTFKIGGPCDWWAEPEDVEDLKKLISFARERKIPYFIIGKGSNVLAKDQGYKGMVIRLSSDNFKTLVSDDQRISAGSGVSLARLSNFAADAGLSGFEFLAGIPGTIGGAIAGNAGTGQGDDKKSVAELLEEVEVLDEKGNTRILNKDQLEFDYRSSNLQGKVVLSARFLLKKDDPLQIKRRMEDLLQKKQQDQELELPSAGCIFRNPQDAGPAGELIDKSGLKDVRIRAAKISSKHANFIVNLGDASCEDVLILMELIKKKVKDDHGILLKEEIKILK
jgi:UDP-N-acetylmuramate dehydrogenase